MSIRLMVTLMLALATSVAHAGNVDLSTIPQRDTVQLTIYNSQDITLVRETRRITFSEGMNALQFSWANTLIDPSSVELRFRTKGDQLDILDTTYPHDRPQVLYWNVRSSFEGEAEVEISYFTSGLTWSAQYVCISDAGEDAMSFEGFVTISNSSGENYENAQVRLVVGEINLVEKIAELAQRGLISADERARFGQAGQFRKLRDRAARHEVAEHLGRAMAPTAAADAPKEIIKEGLSEYFIYTIEGTESIAHTWSKSMRLFEGTSIPFRIAYRHRPREYGDQLVRLFILRNDEASQLGTTPLPDGMVRLFRDNGRDGLSFLTAYQTKYVPIGQEIELNLGPDPEVIHELVRLRSWRDEFWFQDVTGTRIFSQDERFRVEKDYPVVGWNENQSWVERIRNYRDEPIDVELRRSHDGHVVIRTDVDATLHDYRTLQLTQRIDASTVEDLAYELTRKQGRSAKQNNITLER